MNRMLALSRGPLRVVLIIMKLLLVLVLVCNFAFAKQAAGIPKYSSPTTIVLRSKNISVTQSGMLQVPIRGAGRTKKDTLDIEKCLFLLQWNSESVGARELHVLEAVLAATTSNGVIEGYVPPTALIFSLVMSEQFTVLQQLMSLEEVICCEGFVNCFKIIIIIIISSHRYHGWVPTLHYIRFQLKFRTSIERTTRSTQLLPRTIVLISCFHKQVARQK